MALSVKTKQRLAVFAGLLHLSVIAGYAGVASVADRRSRQEKPLDPFASVVALYTIYTAMHADYGFFSPEIGSTHELEMEVVDVEGGKHTIGLEPANLEVAVRFKTLLLIFARDRIYQELVARSIAAYAYERVPAATHITVTVFRHNLPTLEAYRSGELATRVLYFQSAYSTSAGRAP